MKTTPKILACALALFPFLQAQASAQKDCLQPDIAVEVLGGTQARSLDDFLGRALLVKVVHPPVDVLDGFVFAVRTCTRCEQQTAAMNHFHRKFREEGLTVLGVAAEEDHRVRRWADDNRVEHAWASDPDGDLAALVAPQGGCGAALFDAAGRVVWRGDPGALQPQTLLPLLGKAFQLPMDQWGGAAAATRSALRAGDLLKALERAEGIPAEQGGVAIRGTIGYLVDARMELFFEADRAGDRLGQRLRARELAKALDSDPRRAQVEQCLDAAKADPLTAKILVAQREVRECRTLKIRRKKDRERAIAALQEIVRELPGTHAAFEARQMLALIKRRMADEQIRE